MRHVTLLAAAAALAGCSAGGADTAKMEREIAAANAAYDQALIAGDAKALNAAYTGDFRIIDDDANVHDKASQVRFMTEELDLLDARSDDVEVTPLGKDEALVTGRITGRYRMDGAENSFTERYTSVWVRDGDTWKIKHEHSSLVPKPAIGSP